MSPDRLIPILLTLAWLAPLAGAVATWIAGRLAVHRSPRLPAWVAVAVMGVSLNLVLVAGAVRWWSEWSANNSTAWGFLPDFRELSGTYYHLGDFGNLTLSLDYYIDGLALLMFAVVTLIATSVHVYAIAYMTPHDESFNLDQREHGALPLVAAKQDVHDESPGLYTRFFALLQFFVFAMLGLVIAGNLLQVFIFWELVGAASYFLIGYYWDRGYAAAAATKAFVMNRVGDAGFLIGIAILWTAFGTLSFVKEPVVAFRSAATIYSQPPGLLDVEVRHRMPEEWVEGHERDARLLLERRESSRFEIAASTALPSDRSGLPRWWLVVAGLCLFAGCVGKSAQLPLSTWLPDAMAGPTPVSALVHSATMVAAGVYLVGRMYPLFLPEVLLVIAYVGTFTLVYGATCAVFQSDIKRILAWSTVSQLGYMMLAMGVGGREAGLFHLVTHAFFKSLLFLAAGSVIIACHHAQDVARLGGLRKRMPLTAYTSLVGVIAIAGLALPTERLIGEAVAFSGYHSKDSILAASLAFTNEHAQHRLLFLLPLMTAGLTAFYMFRFWLLTFAGRPRDEERHRHVRENPPLMTVPLVLLAVFAAFVAVGGEAGALFGVISEIRPGIGIALDLPAERIAAVHHTASVWALIVAAAGTVLALLVYGTEWFGARQLTGALGAAESFFRGGWKLDLLHHLAVVRPSQFLASVAAKCDQYVIDGLAHGIGQATLAVARLDRIIDERVIDHLVNRLADVTWMAGRGLRQLQTGHLRQYVMALAAAAAILFALVVVLMPKS